MGIQEDRWLSGVMARAAYRVSLAPDETPDAAACAALRAHAAGQPCAFYFAKLGAGAIDAVRRLGALGFYVVDTTVTFVTDRSGPMPPAPLSGVEVVEAGPALHDAVLGIAGSAFRYSRFHLDPQIPIELAHRIKREWMASYVRGQRGSLLLAAVSEGRPAGFVAVLDAESAGRRVRIIDLIGVATEFQQRGVGAALTSFFVREYRDRFDLLQVGTQAANIPSIRLYQKCGFSVDSTGYVLHMHVRNGAAV